MEDKKMNEAPHLAFIRSERPRLSALSGKVAQVHSGRHPELEELDSIVELVFRELEPHPDTDPVEVGRLLAKIRKLTDGYRPPQDACNSYLALYHGLERLEEELHAHILKDAPVSPATGNAEGRPKENGSCCGM